jgi:hypothetical protein
VRGQRIDVSASPHRISYRPEKDIAGKSALIATKPSRTPTSMSLVDCFSLKPHRANLPKAPACRGCNGDKATLEHYLTALKENIDD